MHFLLNALAALVILSVMVICCAMFRSKPDPVEKEGFDEADIYHPLKK